MTDAERIASLAQQVGQLTAELREARRQLHELENPTAPDAYSRIMPVNIGGADVWVAYEYDAGEPADYDVENGHPGVAASVLLNQAYVNGVWIDVDYFANLDGIERRILELEQE